VFTEIVFPWCYEGEKVQTMGRWVKSRRDQLESFKLPSPTSVNKIRNITVEALDG